MKIRSFLSVVASALILCASSVAFYSCNRSNKVKVGVIAPLTGKGAYYGQILKTNFDLAFASDSLYELKYEDSKFEKNASVSAINKLITIDKVPVILGEVTSDNTLTIAPIAEKNKTVLFATIASTDKLNEIGEYFFRNVPSNKIQGITAANFIYSKLGLKSVAVFGQNSEYGVNITTSFKNEYTKLGGEIVFDDSFLEGEVNFKTQLSKVKQSRAKALYIPGNENEPALILKQAKEIGLSIPIIGGDGSSTDNLITMAGIGSEGFYITNIVINKSTAFYKDYRDLFFNKFGKEPSAYDAYAYEGAKIILAALKGAGNNAVDVKNYLHTNSFQSLTGELTFDEKGQVNRLWGIYQVINGKFVELED